MTGSIDVELQRALDAGDEYTSLWAALRERMTPCEYDTHRLQHAVLHGHRYARLPASVRARGVSAVAYHVELVRVAQAALRVYPYAHEADVVRYAGVTAVQYYTDLLCALLCDMRSYDGLPNLTATDMLRLLHVDRNVYMRMTREVRRCVPATAAAAAATTQSGRSSGGVVDDARERTHSGHRHRRCSRCAAVGGVVAAVLQATLATTSGTPVAACDDDDDVVVVVLHATLPHDAQCVRDDDAPVRGAEAEACVDAASLYTLLRLTLPQRRAHTHTHGSNTSSSDSDSDSDRVVHSVLLLLRHTPCDDATAAALRRTLRSLGVTAPLVHCGARLPSSSSSSSSSRCCAVAQTATAATADDTIAQTSDMHARGMPGRCGGDGGSDDDDADGSGTVVSMWRVCELPATPLRWLRRCGAVYTMRPAPAPLQPHSRVTLRLFEHFVMNRSVTDAHEALLYRALSLTDDRLPMHTLAQRLQQPTRDVCDAVDVLHRLGLVQCVGDATDAAVDDDGDSAACRGVPGGRVAVTRGTARSPHAPPSATMMTAAAAAGEVREDARRTHASAVVCRRVAVLYDATLTGALMMTSRHHHTHPALKLYAVTLHEAGRLSHAALDGLLALLDAAAVTVGGVCDGAAADASRGVRRRADTHQHTNTLTFTHTAPAPSPPHEREAGGAAAMHRSALDDGEAPCCPPHLWCLRHVLHALRRRLRCSHDGHRDAASCEADMLKVAAVNAWPAATRAAVLDEYDVLGIATTPLACAPRLRDVHTPSPPPRWCDVYGGTTALLPSPWLLLFLYTTTRRGPVTLLPPCGAQPVCWPSALTTPRRGGAACRAHTRHRTRHDTTSVSHARGDGASSPSDARCAGSGGVVGDIVDVAAATSSPLCRRGVRLRVQTLTPDAEVRYMDSSSSTALVHVAEMTLRAAVCVQRCSDDVVCAPPSPSSSLRRPTCRATCARGGYVEVALPFTATRAHVEQMVCAHIARARHTAAAAAVLPQRHTTPTTRDDSNENDDVDDDDDTTDSDGGGAANTRVRLCARSQGRLHRCVDSALDTLSLRCSMGTVTVACAYTCASVSTSQRERPRRRQRRECSRERRRHCCRSSSSRRLGRGDAGDCARAHDAMAQPTTCSSHHLASRASVHAGEQHSDGADADGSPGSVNEDTGHHHYHRARASACTRAGVRACVRGRRRDLSAGGVASVQVDGVTARTVSLTSVYVVDVRLGMPLDEVACCAALTDALPQLLQPSCRAQHAEATSRCAAGFAQFMQRQRLHPPAKPYTSL